MKIDISIPIDIPNNEIDKYNRSSALYNDICYTLKSEQGTDKIIKDRQDDYKNSDIFICEEDCDFISYDTTTKKAVCSCLTKINLPLISDMKVDKKKLFANFKDIRNIGNFKMLKCYKLLFNKKNFFKNSSNYIFITLFIIGIISAFIFIFYNNKKINNYINEFLQEKTKFKSY